MGHLRWVTILVFAILLMLCQGCGRGEKPASTETVTLRFTTWVTPDLVPLQEKLCRNFERLHPGIRIEHEYVRGAAYWDRLLTSLVGGTAPDCFWVNNATGLHYAQRGALMDLTDLVRRDLNPDDFLPGCLDLVQTNGRIYGVSDGIGPVVVCYNKDAFENAGIPYPDGSWTWNEFRDIARRLTIRDERGRPIQFGFCGFQWEAISGLTFLYVYGGELFNEDGTQCILDQPVCVEALQYLRRLFAEDRSMPSPAETEASIPLQLFFSGRAAMMLSGSWTRRDMRRARELRWSIAHIPYAPDGKRHTFLANRGLAICARTKHPDEAWQFVLYQLSEDGMKVYLEGGDAMPTRKSIAFGPFCEFDPRYPQEDKNSLYLEAVQYGHFAVASPYFPDTQTNAVIVPEIDRYLLLNEISAEEALRRAARQVRIVMNQNKEREKRRAALRDR